MHVIGLGNCPMDRFLGSGKTRLMWSEGLRHLGHQVEFLSPAEFELIPHATRGRKFRQAIGAWLRLRRRNLEECDLIEFYGDEFWLATSELSRRCDRPFLVAHTDGLELLASERECALEAASKSRRSLVRRAIASLTHQRFSLIAFRTADAFVTGSRLDQQYVIEHKIQPEHRTALVPPGVDPEFLATHSPLTRTQRIAYFGSWTKRKGLAELRRVMTEVLSTHLNSTFEIIGAHNSAEPIRQAYPRQLLPRITIHPRRSNAEVAEVLSQCSIVFFPSQYEGFGMALAEAMACGCAAVTTPTGFGAELIDGIEAIICPFGDVAAMYSAIARLLEDDVLRIRIAATGQIKARTLRWEASVAKLEETYLSWLAEHRRSGI